MKQFIPLAILTIALAGCARDNDTPMTTDGTAATPDAATTGAMDPALQPATTTTDPAMAGTTDTTGAMDTTTPTGTMDTTTDAGTATTGDATDATGADTTTDTDDATTTPTTPPAP